MEKNLFDQVWERLRVLTGWRKDREMAEFLEITPATVAGFRKRGTFPEKYAFKIAAVEASQLQNDCRGLEAALREIQARLRETEAELEECKKTGVNDGE